MDIANKRKRTLLISSILILPLMVLVFSISTKLFGAQQGYLAGFIVYWSYCIAFIIILSKNNNKLRELLKLKANSKQALLYSALCFIPIFGAIFVNFLPYTHLITLQIGLLVLVTSLVNGVVEELYWRGLYLVEFKEKAIVGLWLTTFLFGAWHIALYTISEISYGGFAPLVLGAAFMGLLWGFCSRQLESIASPMLAHVLVNIFAFTGLYIENGFLNQ